MLIEFLKDTEVEGVTYHAGETMRFNSEFCRQLIEAGIAMPAENAEKPKKSK
jgi:hypothetical protein